ncbi:MAG: hypothetical protein FWC27_06380 [Firmicutes bacterium]|nr:hypothetical protein [Bacillota bacterium]
MLTTPQIKSLKQVNISVDAEKTKERVVQVWKSAKNAVKNDVVALAGCAKNTVYRVFDTGSLSIKLAIAIGQVLDVNPYYLTGEADEQGNFSEALLLQILEQHGYKKLLAELAPPAEEAPKPKRKYTRKPKAEPAPVPEAEEEAAPEPEPEPEPEIAAEPEPGVVLERAVAPTPTPDIDIPEEDLQALLHSLVILDRAGIAGAQEKLAAVKGILVS